MPANIMHVLFLEISPTYLTVLFFLGLALLYNRNYGYWKKRNVPYLQPRFPLGNIPNPFTMKVKSGQLINNFYKEMKSKGWKHGGFFFFNIPIYMVVDLEYVKNIMVRDFDHFTDRGVFYDEKHDPLNAHLVSLGGREWRKVRTLMNPLFTASKTKNMLGFMLKSVKILLEKVEKHSSMNVYELVSRYTANNIASGIFGLECNIFEEENASFVSYGEKMIKLPKWKIFTWLIAAIFPGLARILRMKFWPEDASAFFTKLVNDCVKYRKENGSRRVDFIQFMTESKGQLSVNQMTAQCIILFLAGFETSSSTLTFALYELAKNEEIQDKAREEVERVLGDEITYEAIKELKYLNQVFDETLRKYPVVLYLTRQCVKDYKLPNEDVIVEKGTIVVIPTVGIQYDEEYFPDGEKFDPERFSDVNKASRHGYAHLPFGEGPRICIGKRFALLQVKIGLAALLKNFKFSLNENTKEPLRLKVDSITVTPSEPVWLNVFKL